MVLREWKQIWDEVMWKCNCLPTTTKVTSHITGSLSTSHNDIWPPQKENNPYQTTPPFLSWNFPETEKMMVLPVMAVPFHFGSLSSVLALNKERERYAINGSVHLPFPQKSTGIIPGEREWIPERNIKYDFGTVSCVGHIEVSECLCVFGGGTYTLLGSCSKIALLFGTIETNQYGIEERETWRDI